MNSKKAKRLRQLVRVMQEKGIVDTDWEVNGHIKHITVSNEDGDRTMRAKVALSVEDIIPAYKRLRDIESAPAKLQSMLKPECGKAVYKGMKKRV